MIYVYSAQVNRFQAKRVDAIFAAKPQFKINHPRLCDPRFHTEYQGFRKTYIWLADDDCRFWSDNHWKINYYNFVVYKFDDNYPGTIKFDFHLMMARFGDRTILPLEIHDSWVPCYHEI